MTSLKVLILEDQPDDAELVLRELRRAGYDLQHEEVETEEAFFIRRTGSRPDREEVA